MKSSGSILCALCLCSLSAAISLQSHKATPQHSLDEFLAMVTQFAMSEGQMSASAEMWQTDADDEPPARGDFLPACVAHVRQLIKNHDSTYTDVQIVPNVEHQCIRSHYFPNARTDEADKGGAYQEVTIETSDGFDEKQACHDFAMHLGAARDQELDTGSTEGYSTFCDNFYEHKYAAEEQELTVQVKAAKKKKEAFNWKLLIAGLCIAAILLCFCCGKKAA